MEDLKQAYAALGLPETASKEELENRYYLLTRRARAQKMREPSDNSPEEAIDIEAVTEAYRFIRDYEEEQAKARYEEEHYGKYKKMAGKKQKWDHFIHYYKFHVLIGIVVVIAIVFGVKSYVDHQAEKERLAKLPPPNLRVMFYGNYFYKGSFSVDTEEMGEQVRLQFPDWQRVISNLTYVPTDIKSSQDIAFMEKSMINLLDDKSDLFIMDKAGFERLAPNELFVPLDTLPGKGASLAASDRAVKSSLKDVPSSEKAYGIDLSGSQIAKDMDLQGSGEFIAAVGIKAAHPDSAVEFIEHYMKP